MTSSPLSVMYTLPWPNVHLALAISGRRSIIEFAPLDRGGGLFGSLLYG